MKREKYYISDEAVVKEQKPRLRLNWKRKRQWIFRLLYMTGKTKGFIRKTVMVHEWKSEKE